MSNKELATYLNNHLAASVTALELLSSLETAQANTDIARFAAELHAEIEAEQQGLETLMERLQITKSRPRQAAGWLDDAAEYVREVDPQKVKSDIQLQVRSNPGRSLLIAGAAGLLLGILLRR